MQFMRQKKDLSAYHLAAKMGIASALVTSWEDGKSDPHALERRKLSDLLSFDAQAL